jgi:hypothetical protein
LADRKMLRHGKKALAALTTPRGTRTGGVDAADTTMTTAITRPVCQGRAIRILASLHAVGVEPDPPEAHPTVVFRDGGPASTPAVPREAAIMRIVCQGRANNRPIEALCPRKCRNSSLSRPKPRLNTEHRTLNTPIRKAFRMGSNYQRITCPQTLRVSVAGGPRPGPH